MIQQVVPANAQPISKIESVLIQGDLSKLTQHECEVYYLKVCETVGLNPLTKPFDYLMLNGKKVLYANKGCAEQLRSIYRISINITAREMLNDLCVVTAHARNPDGREDSGIGAVNVAGLKGEMLANAMMKAETKAKRRATLSICGMNMLDETEVESIPAKEKRAVFGDQPEVGDGHAPDPTNYKITFGQWRTLSIDEVLRKHGPEKLASYIDYLEDPKQVSGRKADQVPLVAEFIDRASDVLAQFEREAAKAAQEPGWSG